MSAVRMIAALRALAVVLAFVGATVLVTMGVLGAVHYALHIYTAYNEIPSYACKPVPEDFELPN